MPPHCDSLDGPVVRAARQALEARDVDLVLSFVPRDGEGEITLAFEKVVRLRKEGGAARQIADRYFFETAMGTHGRTGIRKLLLGSVAQRVVAMAPCPVLTVRTR